MRCDSSRYWQFRTFAFLLLALMIGPTPAVRGQIPVTLTSDAALSFGQVDVIFGLDICDSFGDACESYSFRGFADGFGPGQTASPAFDALLDANPNIRSSVSYDATSMENGTGSGNQFDATDFIIRLRDPVSGEFVGSSSSNSQVALFDAGTNSQQSHDSIIGFGRIDTGLTGFPELIDPQVGPGAFSLDPFSAYDEASGSSFDQVVGEPTATEIRNTIFFDGTLPGEYESGFSSIVFRDTNGDLLSSSNGMFSLPIADLSKISEGSVNLSFEGFGEFHQNEATLSDGRQVSIFVNAIELFAAYDFTSSIATTTPRSVLDEFSRTGDVPLSDIPGTFRLPNVSNPPNDDPPILVDNTTFNRGGNFFFTETVLQDRLTFDPEIAIGYEYELTDVAPDVGFADIVLPSVGSDSEFSISVFDPNTGAYLTSQTLMAGDTFDFTALGFTVNRFSILGIDVDQMVDPENGSAFPALIGFTGTGTGTLRQTPLIINVVPEPSALGMLLLGFVAITWNARRRADTN